MARQCTHYTRRAGLVTNVDPSLWPDGTYGGSFMSVAVCAREECQKAAISKVAGETNSTAAFYPDPQKTAVSA